MSNESNQSPPVRLLCERLELDGFHDALLSAAKISESHDEVWLTFEAGTGSAIEISEVRADMAFLQAEEVVAAGVFIGPANATGEGGLLGRDFESWAKGVEEDAVDILSLLIWRSDSVDEPVIVDVFGATNDRVRIRISCRRAVVRLGSRDSAPSIVAH